MNARRATGAALAAGLLLTGLPAATPAGAAPLAPAASPAGSAPATVRSAVSVAPPVPGARRYDGRLPARVRQVIVVTATSWRSDHGVLTAYVRRGSGWTRVARMPALLGRNGLVVASRRVQSSGTTPAGAFRITSTFGRKANPGTRMPYTRVGWDHWWVQDRRSAWYNQMRLGRQGGFARRTSGYNSSERLYAMGAQYNDVAVIDFNRPNPVIGRGSGIFLHGYGDGPTPGCVAVPRDRMRSLLTWLTPTASPHIIIGEDGWLMRRA